MAGYGGSYGSYSGMWGQTKYPDVIGGMVNTMMWDEEMKMKRQNTLRTMLDDLDPVELMSPVLQNEQTNRLEKIEREITERTKLRNGRLTTQDMMDIDFSMKKFERWQTNQLAMQDAFDKDYKFYQQNMKELRPEVAYAAIDNYITGDENGEHQYKPGSMLKRKRVNLYEHFSNRKIAGRTKPIDETVNIEKGDVPNSFYEITTSIWARQHEKEATVMADYSANPAIEEAMNEWYDEFDAPEKLLWEDQMEKYNNTRDTTIQEPEIKNVALYAGMKMWPAVIAQNTRDVKVKWVTPKTKKEKEGSELKKTNQGTPEKVVGEIALGTGGNNYTSIDVDYGQYVAHALADIPKNTKVSLDQNTFINYATPKLGITSLGAPATKVELEGVSIAGQAYLVNDAMIYEDFPVYIGEDTRTFKKGVGYGKERWKRGQKKGTFTLYPNQPVPDDIYNQIKEKEDDSGNTLKEDEISYMPVAKMSLQTGVRDHIEVLRILDQNLANRLKVINPEYELGTTLFKEPEESTARGKDEVFSILEQNKDKNFVKRILNPEKYPGITLEDGRPASHMMSYGEFDGKYYVYPTIVQPKGSKKLKHLGKDEAMDYAVETGEYIEFDKEEDAAWFSSDLGYKQAWEKEAKPGRSSLGISEEQKSEIVDKATEEGYTDIRKLDTAGGSIMAGVKNGKWYNIETGELIK